MGEGTIWIFSGVLLILAGIAVFAFTHTVITKWKKNFEHDRAV